MTIHNLIVQFDSSFWSVLKDLHKRKSLEEYSIPPSERDRADLQEHITAHRAMLSMVAYHTSPQRTKVLPRTKV